MVRVTSPISTFSGQGHIFGAMKLDISALVYRLNVKSTTMLEFRTMGVHSASRDLLKFWEISANI